MIDQTDLQVQRLFRTLMPTFDANDLAFLEIVNTAYVLWKRKQAKRMIERLRAGSNWQQANLTQWEPGMN
jgi:hypothetical protein